MTDQTPTKCVRDAQGNCSRWCDHPGARPGKPLSTMAPNTVEPLGTLHIGGKIKYAGGEFDVNNVVAHNIFTDRTSGEQTVDITVVLTRPIPLPMKTEDEA